MDIGSQFDDDFFEKPKEKRGTETSNYEAKVCVPLVRANVYITPY